MGRRRPDQVFLPNKYVFPGGRVERADHGLAYNAGLPIAEIEKLRLGLIGKRAATFPDALAFAAVRETFEETGLLLGRPQASMAQRACSRTWKAFLATGYAPDVTKLTYFARAITPPGRPRRYDTRFFIVPAGAISYQAKTTDGELSSLDWFTIEEMHALDLPNITRLILEDLTALLARPADAVISSIPFYFHRNGTYTRELLSHAPSQT